MSQVPDIHAETRFSRPGAPPPDATSFQPVGCISKKMLFYWLRPDCRSYRPGPVRDFLNPERLARCGLTAEQLHHIRIFPPEASAVIVADLRQLRFLP